MMKLQRWIGWGAACILLIFGLLTPVGVSAQDIQGTLDGLPAPWTIETIDDGHIIDGLGQHALAYDSLGNPHITYGSDQLYHAFRSNGAWVIDVIDSSPQVGKNAAIAIDEADHIYITYYDAVNGNLKYATDWKNGWQVSTLASEGDVGSKSFVFATWDYDTNGPEVEVGYLDDSTHQVMYTYSGFETNGYWASAENVSGGLFVTNFAMTVRGYQQHFSIFADGKIFYGYSETGAWHQQLVDNGPCLPITDIAVDSTDTPYIPVSAYVDINFYETYLAYRVNNIWVYPTQSDSSNLIFFGPPTPQYFALSYDPGWNQVFLAMQVPESSITNDLIVWRGLKDIGFTNKMYPYLVSNASGERFPSIAVANYQVLKAGIVYLYGSQLQYQFLSTLNDTNWNNSLTPADTSSDRGECATLKVDNSGRLKIIYRRSDNGALIYRSTTASGWSSPITITGTNEWAVCDQFQRPGMDLLSDGTPVVVYKNLSNELVFAVWTCPQFGRCGFTRSPVDTGLSQGSAAIAVGPSDDLNILYNKAFHLKLAKKTSLIDPAWIITAVDDNKMTEDTPSLDVDALSKIHAAFVDISDRPWWARSDAGGPPWNWFFQFETQTNTLNPVRVMVNPVNNLPQVAYITEIKQLIFRLYSCPLICSWGPTPIVIDTPPDLQNGHLNEMSFVTSSNGKNFFSYSYESPAQNQNGLKLMVREGTNQVPFLIENGVTVDETSIALLPGNVPVIAYHIPSLGQIKLARGSYGIFLPLIKR